MSGQNAIEVLALSDTGTFTVKIKLPVAAEGTLVGSRGKVNKKALENKGLFTFMAEKEGFEPSVGYSPTPDFESGTFNRSATSP